MANTDYQLISDVSETTSSFQLFGGRYHISAVTDGGDWQIERLCADGETFSTIFDVTDFTGVAGYNVVVELGPGTYQFNLFGGDEVGATFEIVRF